MRIFLNVEVDTDSGWADDADTRSWHAWFSTSSPKEIISVTVTGHAEPFKPEPKPEPFSPLWRSYWRQWKDSEDSPQQLTEAEFRSIAQDNCNSVELAIQEGFETSGATYFTKVVK